MNDLIGFLSARYDEEECEARDAIMVHDRGLFALHDVEAKRAVLALWTDSDARAKFPNYDGGHASALEEVFRALATAHASHPGYREEWRP
jgi:hypothetical protein